MSYRTPIFTMVLIVALLSGAATAQQPTADSGAADAFGVKGSVSPLQQEFQRFGPQPVVNVYAPSEETSASDSIAELGPLPDDGALLEHARAVAVRGEVDLPGERASATAEMTSLSLFGGEIRADLVRGVSTTTCPLPGEAAEAAAGSTIVGLEIGGEPVPFPAEPNQAHIRLEDDSGQGLADIRIYEVVPDADGMGWTTRMLHVFTLDPLTQAVNGEIVIAEAHSSLTCAGQEQSGGTDNLIWIDKTVTPSSAAPGDTVTYDLAITNQHELSCTVYEVVDRLPPGFTFVSADGEIGGVEPQVEGREVLFSNPEGWPLEPGQTLEGTLVVDIDADIAPGVYANNVLVRSTCGNFVKGLDAPVTVGAPGLAGPSPGPVGPAPAPAPLPATGAGPGLLGLAALATGLVLGVTRRGP